MKQVRVQERRVQRLQVSLAKKEAALEKALAKEHQKEGKKASQQLQETLQASVKKQNRRQLMSIHLPPPQLQQEVVSTTEPSKLPSGGRSRTRRKPAYLADFILD